MTKVCYTVPCNLMERSRIMAGTYKTAGRQRLLDFLQSHPDRQFTVDELATELNRTSQGKYVGKSTLYRHLSELCDEGTARKYRSDTQSAYVYQYVGTGDCCRHFHLKCLSCGELVHLECAVSEELLFHISSHHGFEVDSGRSILYGMCEVCASMEQKQHPTDTRGCACGHHHHK